MKTQSQWKFPVIVLSVLLILVYSGMLVQAQEKELKIDHIFDLGVETTQAFLQDQDGFLWFGTAGGGLFRYDGYELKNYGIGPQRLINGNVTKILEDRQNADILWLVTLTGGFTRFDKATDTFTHYTHTPATFKLTEQSLRNLGKENISDEILQDLKALENQEFPDEKELFNALKEHLGNEHAGTYTALILKHARNESQGLATSSVADIIQDSQNPDVLWLVGNRLLQQFHQHTETFSANLFAPPTPNIPENPEFYTVLEDPQNPDILWLAGFGLAKFGKTTQQFTLYLHDPDNPKSLGFESNYVGSFTQDKDDPNIFWLGYWDGAMLDKFDTRTETFTHYPHIPNDSDSLREGAVMLIADDGEGMLWLGGWAESNGLTAFEKQTETFRTYRHVLGDSKSVSTDTIVNVAKDRTGILWIVHLSGTIDSYDRYAQNFTLYQQNPNTSNSLVDDSVYSIYEDHDGLLWFGTSHGLSQFDKQTNTFTNYTHHADDPASLDSDYILSTYQDSAGDLWVGGYDSPLLKFDPATGQVRERVELPEGSGVAEILEDPENPDILWLGVVHFGFARFHKATHALHYYSPNRDQPEQGVAGSDMTEMIHDNREPVIWLGSWSRAGLNRFDKTTETFTHYFSNPNDPQTLSYDEIGGLYQTRSGTLWIGTRGGGLNKFNKDTGTFTRYGEEHGVPTTVNAILEDERGKLWLSTNYGIVRFNPNTERVEKHYTNADGLQGDAFLYESGLKTRDGEMWFGGTNGVNRFHPAYLLSNPHIPPIILTSLTQAGESVNWDEHKVPERLDRITLTWKNNFFEFQYVALNYTISKKNQYQYMLEGLDQDWYDAGTKRTGRYSGIPAGTYTLKILGSNNDGMWNNEGVSLDITVIPPFWQTGWFRAVLIFIVLTAGFGTHHVRLRALEKQKQTLEILVKERTEELYQAKKRAEEAMYETERRFRVIFNQTFQFIGLANSNGTIRELNHTTLEFFQVEASQVVEKYLWESPWFDLPAEQEKIREAVAKAAEGQFVRFETSALAPDGSRMVLDFSMKPMWGEFNNIYLLILEGRDLTDYRRTQEALLETTKAKERFESELRIAHDIQMEIIPRTFPPFPDRSEFDIYAVLESAKEVGGDLYDFFFIDDKHLWFVIGDVSDKGVPAALFMSAAKTLIKAIATRTFPGPDGRNLIIPRTDTVLAAVNYELSIENDSCMFVTVFCGILNTQTGDISYTNGGHNPPLLIRQGGEATFITENKCTLIGADEEAMFTQSSLKLQPGDTILLYTDGVTEAKSINDEFFEEDRLQASVSAYQGSSAEGLVNTVLESVQTFSEGAPQADDITILALTYLSGKEETS